jgi:acetoin utilization deacetylase AcuC-like enzyme
MSPRQSVWRPAQPDGISAVSLGSRLPGARDAPGGHPEPPARIAEIERSLAERGWLGYEVRQAPPASPQLLVAVHSAEYVDAVRSMSDRGAGAFDKETVVSAGSYRAAVHASGAACAMVEALLAAGGPRLGFCATRPPGHHARTDTTCGFCLFNHIAVASRHALDSLGARPCSSSTGTPIRIRRL